MKIKVASATLFAMMLLACGGSISSFDVFQPRPVVESDIELKQFSFGWLPNGNPLVTGVGTYTLAFGEVDSSGNSQFTLTLTEGGTASGPATLSGDELSVTIAVSDTEVLPVGHNTKCRLEADVADGRIRLTNLFTGSEATSDIQHDK